MTDDVLCNLLSEIFDSAVSESCAKHNECYLCCSTCAAINAHFEFQDPAGNHFSEFVLANSSKAMKLFSELKEKYGWDEEKGFLGEVGCKLPRLERSCICLLVVCRPLREKIGEEKAKHVERLVNELKQIRRKEGRLI